MIKLYYQYHSMLQRTCHTWVTACEKCWIILQTDPVHPSSMRSCTATSLSRPSGLSRISTSRMKGLRYHDEAILPVPFNDTMHWPHMVVSLREMLDYASNGSRVSVTRAAYRHSLKLASLWHVVWSRKPCSLLLRELRATTTWCWH
jgi:hypothetical protein